MTTVAQCRNVAAVDKRDAALEAALARGRARRRLPGPAARRQLRERAGLSQQAVAAALGVTREAVAQWESGRRSPRPATAMEYVTLLDRLAREGLR
jgi:DNA-binding transcriptional regulator YiaG